MKKANINLDADEIEFALRLGNGNFNNGVRTALCHHKLFATLWQRRQRDDVNKNNRAVYLSDEDVEIAKGIGNNSISKGIRQALGQYKTAALTSGELTKDTKRRTVYLYDNDWEWAKIIGHNNVSLGIRLALHQRKLITSKPRAKAMLKTKGIYLAEELLNVAKILGNNNLSKGVRIALGDYKDYLSGLTTPAKETGTLLKAVAIYLDEEELSAAQSIGHNNVSQGIRVALRDYQPARQTGMLKTARIKRNIRLNTEDMETARRIGNGNLCRGIRIALQDRKS